MKNKHIWIPVFVFIGAGIVSLITSIIDYKVVNPALAYSAQSIQFNYDGAADGLDPDGNSFDPIGFLSDDVIEAALTKSNLNIPVEDVRPYIAIENVVPKNLLKELTSYEKILTASDEDGDNRPISSKDYHPVRYKFVVYKNKMMSKGKLNEFVANIVDEYNATFYETYKKSFTQNTYEDLFDLDGYDYIYQSQIYATRIEVLMNYASNIQAEHEDFFITVNGVDKKFTDLVLKGQQLIGTDASKINNIIILNALSKDVGRLKDYYTYLLENLNYDKIKYTADYDAITAQLIGDPANPNDNYKINPTVYVGTGENVIQVQDNTAATYNNLLNQQIGLANRITSIDKTITDYTEILDKLNHATPGTTAEATVQNMIISLGKDYEDLDALFQILVDAYNDKYVKEGVTSKSKVKYTSDSIFSGSFIAHTIKVAAPIMLTTMLGIAIFYLVRAIRKEKEPKEVK